jgi:hypothetical protein
MSILKTAIACALSGALIASQIGPGAAAPAADERLHHEIDDRGSPIQIYWRGGWGWGGWGWGPGIIAGAIIGGAIASGVYGPYGYYGGPYYYGSPYAHPYRYGYYRPRAVYYGGPYYGYGPYPAYRYRELPAPLVIFKPPPLHETDGGSSVRYEADEVMRSPSIFEMNLEKAVGRYPENRSQPVSGAGS